MERTTTIGYDQFLMDDPEMSDPEMSAAASWDRQVSDDQWKNWSTTTGNDTLEEPYEGPEWLVVSSS